MYTTVSSIPIAISIAVPTSLQSSFDGAGWVPKNLYCESKETQCVNNLVIQFKRKKQQHRFWARG